MKAGVDERKNNMDAPQFDGVSILIALIFAGTVATAIKILWTPLRRAIGISDLVHRELTGWTDEATGYKHPSLRSEIKEVRAQAELTRELKGWTDPITGTVHPPLREEIRVFSDRLKAVELATKQLMPNHGSHLADEIRQTKQKVEGIESQLEELLEFKRHEKDERRKS